MPWTGGMGDVNMMYSHYIGMEGPRISDPMNPCSNLIYDATVDQDLRSFSQGGAFNHFYRGTGLAAGPETYVSVGITGTTFGMPQALLFLPDGTEILDARMEISCTGLTRIQSIVDIRYTGNCLGDGIELETVNNSPAPVITTSGLNFDVVGFTSPTEFESLGITVGGAPEGGGQVVVECTDIIRAMFAARATGVYAYGFAMVPTPELFGSTEVPPLPDEEYFTIPECAHGSCPGRQIVYWPRLFTDNVTWSNISLGNVAIKVQYPESERERMLIMPRWPAMGSAS